MDPPRQQLVNLLLQEWLDFRNCRGIVAVTFVPAWSQL